MGGHHHLLRGMAVCVGAARTGGRVRRHRDSKKGEALMPWEIIIVVALIFLAMSKA